MNLLEKRKCLHETLCLNCGARRVHVQRGIVSFSSLSSRRLRCRFVGSPENKKRGGGGWLDICIDDEKDKKMLWL